MNLIEELNASRIMLDTALKSYLNACSAIQSYCTCETSFDDVLRREDIMNCAESELNLFPSYTTRIYQAKAALGATRNHSSRVVPISILLTEILSRIFSMACSELARPGYSSINTILLSNYPMVLSQVCSRWRWVAVGTHALWSRIAVHPGRNTSMSKGTLARAETYIDRSGQLPLQINVSDFTSGSIKHTGEDLFQFLASISTRLSTLEVVSFESWKKYHSSLLRSCFLNAVPGVLNRLDLWISGCDLVVQRSTFIEAAENPHHAGSVLIDLPEQFLEDLWLPVSILQLRGNCPHWTSKAYHGLVELQLSCPRKGTISMTESQLASILASSPALRIFYFEVELTEFGTAPVESVRLEELEELGLGSMEFNQIGAFLRQLAPGVKRLQLSLRMPNVTSAELGDDIENFFARSNVSKLRVHHTTNMLRVFQFYRLSPHLQVLALEEFSSSVGANLSPFLDEHQGNSRAMHPSENQLYLLSCRISLSDLQWMLRKYPTHTLTLWRTKVLNNDGQDDGPLEHGILARDCPVVNILDYHDPKPTPGWYRLFAC